MNSPNCGAPLTQAGGTGPVICDHCGSLIAIKAPEARRPPEPATHAEAPSIDPRYEYGQVPAKRPESSSLASVTLGPADAAHVIQLLRDRQELEAIQFYQLKTGGSLGEAKEAISAIRAGLRDASGPLVALTSTSGPVDVATGASGCRVWVDRCGCVSGGALALVILMLCTSAGCGAYVQSKEIYKCSMREIKAALASQQIFNPPIDGGYVVLTGNFHEGGDFSSWSLNGQYLAPVWGSNGFGVIDAHIYANNTGWNTVSASLFKDGKRRQLLPSQKIECGK